MRHCVTESKRRSREKMREIKFEKIRSKGHNSRAILRHDDAHAVSLASLRFWCVRSCDSSEFLEKELRRKNASS